MWGDKNQGATCEPFPKSDNTWKLPVFLVGSHWFWRIPDPNLAVGLKTRQNLLRAGYRRFKIER
jgi:hypothetical protein